MSVTDDVLLIDAKQEYTDTLIQTLAPSMYKGIRSMYDQSKRIQNEWSVYRNFQSFLENVPRWNNYLIDREVQEIQKETGCDYLDNLITAVFVSHCKILTSVKVGNFKPRLKKVDLRIPETSRFIHQCYIDSAREFYRNPLLFSDDAARFGASVQIKNTQTAKAIIEESIRQTIRRQLPLKNILNEYMNLQSNGHVEITGGARRTIEPTDFQKQMMRWMEFQMSNNTSVTQRAMLGGPVGDSLVGGKREETISEASSERKDIQINATYRSNRQRPKQESPSSTESFESERKTEESVSVRKVTDPEEEVRQLMEEGSEEERKDDDSSDDRLKHKKQENRGRSLDLSFSDDDILARPRTPQRNALIDSDNEEEPQRRLSSAEEETRYPSNRSERFADSRQSSHKSMRSDFSKSSRRMQGGTMESEVSERHFTQDSVAKTKDEMLQTYQNRIVGNTKNISSEQKWDTDSKSMDSMTVSRVVERVANEYKRPQSSMGFGSLGNPSKHRNQSNRPDSQRSAVRSTDNSKRQILLANADDSDSSEMHF